MNVRPLPCRSIRIFCTNYGGAKSRRSDRFREDYARFQLADENNLRSVAFCCISTGEFHFPNRRAAQIAIATVKKFLATHELEIIFNVFKELDEKIYREVISKQND